MIKIKVNFDKKKLMREAIEQMRKQLRSRLNGAGLSGVKIDVKPDGQYTLTGSEEDIAEAKKLLK